MSDNSIPRTLQEYLDACKAMRLAEEAYALALRHAYVGRRADTHRALRRAVLARHARRAAYLAWEAAGHPEHPGDSATT